MHKNRECFSWRLFWMKYSTYNNEEIVIMLQKKRKQRKRQIHSNDHKIIRNFFFFFHLQSIKEGEAHFFLTMKKGLGSQPSHWACKYFLWPQTSTILVIGDNEQRFFSGNDSLPLVVLLHAQEVLAGALKLDGL